MDETIEQTMQRHELADYLDRLAQQIRKGTVGQAGSTWHVPDEIPVRFRTREKKGRLETKLQWCWSTLADYDQADRVQVADWQRSIKALKKRMATAFKEVSRATEQGSIPERQALDALVETSTHFAAIPEPEWQEAMAEYMDHLDNLVRAVEQGQAEQVRHEVRDLQYRLKACHREFK